MHPWTFYALEIASDRARDARRQRLLADLRAAQPAGRHWSLRRPTARILAAMSRTTAAGVRRLDDCVADDLGRSLAPTK